MVDLTKKSLSDLVEIQFLMLNKNPYVVSPNYKGREKKDYTTVKDEIDRREGEYKTLAAMYRILRNKFSEYERTRVKQGMDLTPYKRMGPPSRGWRGEADEHAKREAEKTQKILDDLERKEKIRIKRLELLTGKSGK
ncbi:MAG: hypothetical protein V1839_00240 [archaeon]